MSLHVCHYGLWRRMQTCLDFCLIISLIFLRKFCGDYFLFHFILYFIITWELVVWIKFLYYPSLYTTIKNGITKIALQWAIFAVLWYQMHIRSAYYNIDSKVLYFNIGYTICWFKTILIEQPIKNSWNMQNYTLSSVLFIWNNE